MSRKIYESEVWHQNVRDAQIGGEEDGIDPEVMKEIGYIPPHELPENRNRYLDLGASAMAEVESGATKDSSKTSSKRNLSMTPAAVKAREKRAQKKQEEQQRIADNADPWGIDLGGI